MISEITDKSSVIIKAIGHKWDDGEITREATYDEDGEKTYTCQNDPSHTKIEVIPKKITRSSESENTADTSGSSTNVSRRIGEESNSGSSSSSSGSSSSDSGSSSSSGSSSKTYTAAQAKVDQVNNVTSSHKIPENHQVETGVAASDVGGNWDYKVNADTWTYTKSDGTLSKGEWLSLDYNGLRYWYYFDDDTNMRTN